MQIIIKYPKDLKNQFKEDKFLLLKYSNQMTSSNDSALATIDVNLTNDNIENLTKFFKILNVIRRDQSIEINYDKDSLNKLEWELKCFLLNRA